MPVWWLLIHRRTGQIVWHRTVKSRDSVTGLVTQNPEYSVTSPGTPFRKLYGWKQRELSPSGDSSWCSMWLKRLSFESHPWKGGNPWLQRPHQPHRRFANLTAFFDSYPDKGASRGSGDHTYYICKYYSKSEAQSQGMKYFTSPSSFGDAFQGL